MSDLSKSKGHSFAMERMMAKDEEDRLERVNTKQKRGTPTVRSNFINGSFTNDVTQLLPQKQTNPLNQRLLNFFAWLTSKIIKWSWQTS